MIFYGMKEGEHVIGVLSGMAGTWWYMGPILGGRRCSIRNTETQGCLGHPFDSAPRSVMPAAHLCPPVERTLLNFPSPLTCNLKMFSFKTILQSHGTSQVETTLELQRTEVDSR